MFALLSVVLFSCKSGETIADKGIIQKRKYQKGYHVNIKSPFDSKNNSVHHEKTSEESFTASLRASISTDTGEPLLAEPIAKESKLNTENTHVKQARKVNADKPLEKDLGDEATASIDDVTTWKSKKDTYSNKAQIKNQPQDYYAARRVSTVALLSFIFAIFSLFFLGIPFGLAAIILGIIGIVQVENNRDVYKGQGFAIVGLIIGLLAVVLVLLYIASMS